MPYLPDGRTRNPYAPIVGPAQAVQMRAEQGLNLQSDPVLNAGSEASSVPYPAGTAADSTGYPAEAGLMQYLDQQLAAPEPPAAPSDVRVSSQPPNEGLGLSSNMGGGDVSSGGGGMNWLMALGGALQAGGAAHFGNYNVPQQYFQLHQEAERRKQEYAMQQAKLAEDRKNHQWSQVFQTLSNENLGPAQRIEVLKSLQDNPYAAEAAQSVNAKMIGDFKAAGEYLPRKPEEYAQALQKGDLDWHQVAAETKMGLKLKEQVLEKRASTMAYKTLQRMAQENPDDQDLQDAALEARMEKQKKIADANVAVVSAPSEIANNRLKPQVAQADLALKQAPREVASGVLNDQGQVFNDIFDPKKGTTERIVGTPLQRTQEVPASVTSRAMNTIDAVKNMKGTIDTLRSLLVTPDGKMRDDLVGAVGGLKGLVYGASAQADAFAQLLRGGASRIDAHISDTKSDVPKSAFFDPSLSKADLLQNILAYQLAMVHSDGGLVSNADFKEASKSLGGSKLLTGAADIIERLNTLEDIGNQRAKIAQDRLNERGPQQRQGVTEQPKKFDSIEEYKKHYGLQ